MARKKSARVAALLGKSSRAGADEALESLVHQFTDPLAFLRELIQNSLDAESTRVDVEFAFKAGDEPTRGRAAIAVVDNGEGMDEAIIDNHLLTLFSSTKEGDLTKIGKFGIGFVSIFAIEPELAVVETARGGEAWRILFHPDGHFEKLRLTMPLDGTTVRLYKQMNQEAFDHLRGRGRETITYWCKYAQADIVVDGESIVRPFRLEAPLAVYHQEQGTELWVGLPPLASSKSENKSEKLDFKLDRPVARIGLYNRGLTLVEGRKLPGDHPDLDGLSILARSRYLEHTLTRDDVIRDENYDKLINIVRREVESRLRPMLFERMAKLALFLSGPGVRTDPGPPDIAACCLYARLPGMAIVKNAGRRALFPAVEGEPLSLKQIRRHADDDTVLTADRSNPVTRQLAVREIPVLLRFQGQDAFLAKEAGLRTMDVNLRYRTSLPVDPGPAAKRLLDLLPELLDSAEIRVKQVLPGDLDYPGSPISQHLFLRQEEAFGLTRLRRDDRPTLFGGARVLVLNHRHSLCEKCIRLADSDLPLAALLLAQAVIALEGGDSRAAAGLAELTMGMEMARG